MASTIHPTAIISPEAELGEGVSVGPSAIVGPHVTVGDGCDIGAHVILEKYVRMGARCRVGPGSIIGGDPQDLKYKGEETWAEIGEDTIIREYVTINRGTTQSRLTRLGKGCLVMTYVHVAHDCHIGDGVILSNGVGLSGHVTIGDKAIIGGMTGVHQFVRIGAHAFIGGAGRIRKDVPPFCKADDGKIYGLNTIGLQRSGFTPETLAALQKAYRLFYRSSLNIRQALDRAKDDLSKEPEVEAFVAFIEQSERGVMV
ncbi:MAG: acyl-ACP--UDP-N-acetylglucosamine O-acyltransferase [Gemmatimonadales bacterium]